MMSSRCAVKDNFDDDDDDDDDKECDDDIDEQVRGEK